MFRIRLEYYLCLILLTLPWVQAFTISKTTVSGNIAGVVRSVDGNTIPNVQIRLHQGGMQILSVQSNARGEYRIMNLAPGTYELDFEHSSTQKLERRISVGPGRGIFCNPKLELKRRIRPDVYFPKAPPAALTRYQRIQQQHIPVSGAYVSPYLPPPESRSGLRVLPTAFVGPAVNSLLDIYNNGNTAYFNYLKSMLADGILPDLQELRIDELINNFPLRIREQSRDDDIDPHDPMDLKVHIHKLDNPFNSDLDLIGINLQAPMDRSDLHQYIMIMDTSGHMATRHKLDLAIDCLNRSLNTGIVFSDLQIILAEAIPRLLISEQDYTQHINISPGSVRASGIADLEAAIRFAGSQIKSAQNARILLFSDGMFSPDTFIRLSRSITELSRQGAHISIIGMGRGQFNDARLYHLAESCGAQYHYVSSVDDYLRIAHAERRLSQAHTVQDLQIKLEIDSGDIVKRYRIIGNNSILPTQADGTEQGYSAEVRAPTTSKSMNLCGAQEITVFLELDYQETASKESSQIARLMLSYRLPGDEQIKYRDYAIDLSRLNSSNQDPIAFAQALDVAKLGLLLAEDPNSRRLGWQNFTFSQSRYGSINLDLHQMQEQAARLKQR